MTSAKLQRLLPSFQAKDWKAVDGAVEAGLRLDVALLQLAIDHSHAALVTRILAAKTVTQPQLNKLLKSLVHAIVQPRLASPLDPRRRFVADLLRAGATPIDDLLALTVVRRDWVLSFILIEAGADANEVLHRMVREDQPKAIQWLVVHGKAKVDDRCEGGATALIQAAQMGRLAVVKSLLTLRRPPRLNLQSSNGSTALHRAAARGHLAIAKLLVAKRAKNNLVDAELRTALMLAAEAPEENLAMVRLLVAAGSPLQKKNKAGQTALLIAQAKGLTKTERFLLKVR
jgi:hypothetical protein